MRNEYVTKIDIKNNDKNSREKLFQAYSEFINLLVKDEYNKIILRNSIKYVILNREKDKHDILYDLYDMSYEEKIYFIVIIDWKEDIRELELQLYDVLNSNYPDIPVELPKASLYGENLGVCDNGVFDDYSNALRKKFLQLGFIKTDGDEYVVIVHKIDELNLVENIVSRMGFEYVEKQNIQIEKDKNKRNKKMRIIFIITVITFLISTIYSFSTYYKRERKHKIPKQIEEFYKDENNRKIMESIKEKENKELKDTIKDLID